MKSLRWVVCLFSLQREYVELTVASFRSHIERMVGVDECSISISDSEIPVAAASECHDVSPIYRLVVASANHRLPKTTCHIPKYGGGST